MPKKIEIDISVNSQAAINNTDKLGESLEKTAESTGNLTGSTESLGEGLSGLGGGFGGAIEGAKGLGQQFLKLIANPIVAIIAAIAVVLGTLFKAFSRTEAGGNKLNKGMNVLKGVFNAFLKAIEPVASFIVDTLIKSFNDMANAASKAVELVNSGLRKLGFGEAADAIDKFTSSTDALIKKTNELSDLESKLLVTRREQSLIEKQALIDAEKLRQQRDNASNSLQDRIKFNTQLGEVLKRQSEQELAIASDSLRAAQLKLDIDGKTTEALDGLAEAQLEILDIQERINGQQSEQLANESSLREEGKALSKERSDAKQAELKEEAEAIAESKALAEEKRKAEEDALNASIDAEIESIKRGLALKRELKLKLAEEGLDDPNITPEEIAMRAEAVQAAREEVRQAEIEQVQANFEADLISQEERDAIVLQSEATASEAKNALKDKEIDIELKVKAAKASIQKENLNIASKGISLIAGLFSKNKKVQAAALVAENAAGIAKQVINTNLANAVAAPLVSNPATAPAGLAAIARNNISLGIGIASSIAATAKGLAALKAGGSAGSAPSVGSGGGSASAPSISSDTLSSNSNIEAPETETVGEGAGLNQIKAIVVESDITTAQKNVLGFQESSEIG